MHEENLQFYWDSYYKSGARCKLPAPFFFKKDFPETI